MVIKGVFTNRFSMINCLSAINPTYLSLNLFPFDVVLEDDIQGLNWKQITSYWYHPIFQKRSGTRMSAKSK